MHALDGTTRTRTFQPDEALTPFVRAYHFVEAPRSAASQIMAAWTKQTLIFQYGNRIRTSLGGVIQPMHEIALNGPVTVPYLFQPQSDRFRLLIVEFTATGLFELLGQHVHSFVDTAVDAISRFPDHVRGPLCDALYEVDDLTHKIALIDAALSRIKPATEAAEQVRPVLPAIVQVREAEGWVSVQTIADKLNTSQRHFRRLFRSTTGLTAKSYARILRFNAALRRLRDIDDPAQLYAAISDGKVSDYSDQAHFVHEFSAYTGYTPTMLPMERFETFALLSDLMHDREPS